MTFPNHITTKQDREFLFDYHFEGLEWGICIHADNPAQAKEKIKAVSMARYRGEVGEKIPLIVPGTIWWVRLKVWWRNLRGTA